MNRRHTADAARKAVRQAQEAGFGNVTVDLIFGVPGFGAATLARNLRETVALGVQHVSAYHLTVEPQTAFGRRMAQGRFSPRDGRDERRGVPHGAPHAPRRRIRALRSLELRPARPPGDPQQLLLERRPLSGNRPCGTFVRRRMPTLGPSPTSGATWPAATATNRSA